MPSDLPILPLPPLSLRPIVESALLEDFGLGGDVTSLLIPKEARKKARLVTRQDGVISGLDVAQMAFLLIDPEVSFNAMSHDGDMVKAGTVLAEIDGPARAIVQAERVALNFLGHMSGIATLTSRFVEKVKGTHARIAATRKTLPNLRMVQKYAVSCAGGLTHRMRLDDCILIKDNHIAFCGGDIGLCVSRARQAASHTLKIELEIDSLTQLEAALEAKVDIIMCDNFTRDDLKAAVKIIDKRAIVEASGGVSLDTVSAIAHCGVDIISVGALTHSAPNLDIGLDA